MKIAMIGHKRIPSREGGVEIVVEELSKRMVERGHTVHVFNRKGHHVSGHEYDDYNLKSKEYNGIRLITIPTPQSKQLNAVIYTFLATCRALMGKYDVIHYHAEGPCYMIWLPHLLGIRTIATIHGLDWQRSKWGGFATKFLLTGEKMAAKHADEIIVLSEYVQAYFWKTYHRKPVYIPNGIEKKFRKNADIIKKVYHLEKDGYILFLARIVPEKGLHYLIEAYQKINTSLKLVIAGGSSHTNGYMNKIKEMAAEDERILLTGFVEGKLLDELYSNAYLYVLPSDVEGMPISLLEAMSYGTCCLVSDIPENKAIVEDKAFCFQKGNVADLKEKLNYLLKSMDIVKKYREETQAFVCKKYNWDDVVDKTIKLYSGETLLRKST